ncbi:MAG: DUF975 family protein [Clostridiales bacterium]|nr:DUF975 family protein [Lachnospiraceae bacterium]MDD6617153.1 DUF975 family protein [Clostridiales bacterium]MDY4769669.1 DUF975 family protein [Lachnospiraceae bacterium]
MKRKISELKALARKSLDGYYALLAGALVLISFLSGIGGALSVMLFQGNSMFNLVMSQIFSLIISVVMSVFSAGVYYMFLNVSRGKKTSMQDVTYLFYHHPDRIIVVSLIVTVVQYLLMLPSMIMNYRMDVSANLLEVLQQSLLVSLVMFVGIVVAQLVTMPIAFGYYLLIDDVEMNATDALKKSMQMMKGNYGRYIYMQLSFLGLMILGVLTLYVGFIWIMPYMQMTEIEFYREILGELDESEKTTTSFEENWQADTCNAEG